MQCIEGMKEFFLRRLFTSDELDIVNQQNIDISVFITETLSPVVTDGVDKFIRKFLGGNIYNFAARTVFQNIMSNRMHQMRLT
ncbi:hypothetical protein D3C81_1268830 [compost metagenome]